MCVKIIYNSELRACFKPFLKMVKDSHYHKKSFQSVILNFLSVCTCRCVLQFIIVASASACTRKCVLQFIIIVSVAVCPFLCVPVTTAWLVLKLRMEERPPIWRVAANKPNKQSRAADKGWSSILGDGRGASNSSL